MEFHEKLQELRKSRGLTQEEVAESLYVSRTAISKWESGRGYPNIDSLKEISKFFSVSIDDLLSGEKLISIAETENKRNIQSICSFLFGIVDVFSFLLIVLPLYPKTVDGFVYSVNLLAYREISILNRRIYWIIFLSLILIGILKLLFTYLNSNKFSKQLNVLSVIVSSASLIFLALSGIPQNTWEHFLLYTIKR